MATTLQRRVRLLAWAAIAYNVIEAGVALTAGTEASSTALVGFGLDSAVEVGRPGRRPGDRRSRRARGPGGLARRCMLLIRVANT